MHIRFAQDRKHAFWLSAALQEQLTAPFCHYSHTCAGLPVIQVCNCSTLMHIRFAQDRKHAFWLNAALQKQLTNTFFSLNSHLCKFAFHTGLQLPNTDAQQVCPGQETCFLAQCCSAKTGDSTLMTCYPGCCQDPGLIISLNSCGSRVCSLGANLQTQQPDVSIANWLFDQVKQAKISNTSWGYCCC